MPNCMHCFVHIRFIQQVLNMSPSVEQAATRNFHKLFKASPCLCYMKYETLGTWPAMLIKYSAALLAFQPYASCFMYLTC